MNKSLRRRVAAVATTATVGGLLLPFLAAGSALAATEPTGLTVSPVAQTVAVNSSPTITATLTGGSGTPAYGVYYRITGGPDQTTGNTGKACPASGAANTYTCSFTGTSAGTDTFQIFYDAAGNGTPAPPATPTTANFQVGDPAATASVTFAGPATRTSITPTSAKISTASTSAYTVLGFDANGNPASGPVDVSISQTIPTGPDPLNFTSPSDTMFPAAPGGTGTTPTPPVLPSSSTPSGTSNTTWTNIETFTFANGAANIGIASSAAGTVAISGGVNSTTFTAGTASLAVSQGNTSSTPSVANDDNAFATAQASNTTSFINKTVSSQVTVTNAAGDALGGVRVTGAVTAGPNKGASATTTKPITDQLGHVTLTYPAGATPGTDTLQAFVNQDKNAPDPNTPNADPKEPQSTTSVTVVNQPAGLTLTSTQDAGTAVPTTQPSTPVVYTLKDGTGKAAAGLTINFAVDPTSLPGTKAYTVAPKTAVTDANGQVTVTVTNPAPAAGDKIIIDASLAGDPSVFDNKVALSYQASAATNATLTPLRQTLAAGSQVVETLTVLDQFSKPVTGLSVKFAVATGSRNDPATNSQASGSGTTDANGKATFVYTDAGGTVTAANQSAATDVVTATVGATTAYANVQFVPGTATTSTLTIRSATTTTTGTTVNPAAGASATVTAIKSVPKDSAGNILFNKTVTFTSNGVGSFTDALGNPTGNTTTANVDTTGDATVFVRSAATGVQNITASAEGVSSSTLKITYNNDFVAITPQRMVDTRTGQGAVYNYGGATPVGPLPADTVNFFGYAQTQMPLNATAYVFNVTAINPSGVGNLRVSPTRPYNSFVPNTSVVNYQPGKDVANLVVVPNNGSDTMGLFSANSSANVVLDLVGYYPTSAGIKTMTPVRVADTRDTLTPVGAGETRSFQIAGQNGIPPAATGTTAGTKAVALNVTAINPTGLGNLRIFADGVPVPTTSNINYIAGQDKSATVIVDVPANGKIDVYSAGSSADVSIDAYASYGSGSNTINQTPVRVLDTRSSNSLAAGGSVNVQVSGVAGVPADAQAVLVSVTGIHTSGSTGVGNLRVFPTGGAVPNVSNLNYVSPTSDVANFAIVKVGANGQITLNTQGSPTDATVDVVGYVKAG